MLYLMDPEDLFENDLPRTFFCVLINNVELATHLSSHLPSDSAVASEMRSPTLFRPSGEKHS
jgi:hypothetical protein